MSADEAGNAVASGATTSDALPDALRAHSAGNSLGFMLWHASLQWTRALDATLAPLTLTHAQFHLLATTWWLGREGALPYQRHVAEHAGFGEVMASQVLRALERNGLITRRPHPEDARAMGVSVTPEGKRLAEAAIIAVESVENTHFREIVDSPSLLAMLRQLAGRTPAGDSMARRP